MEPTTLKQTYAKNKKEWEHELISTLILSLITSKTNN